MAYSVGESVVGTVTGVTAYGAFVRLPDGSTGMIHISKISRDFVSDIHSVIKKDDVVTATVIANDSGKTALSLVGDQPKKSVPRMREPRKVDEKNDFESMLSSFKSASDEKLAHFNRKGNERKRRR